MSTTNVTYNYKFKQPNFWQSFGMGMLYQGVGAFGSLTGCGTGMGGYNLGGCSSLGGSLFNMMGGYGMGNMYANPSTFFGMSGLGCGSYGMSGMYGMGGYGMGCCGMSDAAFGAQMGLMGASMITEGITASIKSHKEARKELESNFEQALKTLGISKETALAEKMPTFKAFDPSALNTQITTAASNAILALKWDDKMPTELIDINSIKQDENSTPATYTYTSKVDSKHSVQNGDITQLKAAINADNDLIRKNNAKKLIHDELGKMMEQPGEYNSTSIPSDEVYSGVKKAVQEREEAEKKWNDAQYVVTEYRRKKKMGV